MTRPSNVCFKNIAQLLCTAFVNRNEHTQVKKNTSHECSMILWFERIWFYNILQPFHIWLRFSLDRRCHGPWAHWLLILLTYLASKKEDEKWANDWPILGKSLGYSWILPVFYVGLSIFLGASWVASCGAWPPGLLDETFSHLALDAGGGDLPHLLLEQNAHDFFQVQLKMS